MTITVNKNSFLNAIKAVKTSVGKGGLQPILSTIHIKSENGGLTLTATDLETSSRAVCEANITEPIDVCINANNLENIVMKLNDLISLDLKDTKILIKSGKTKFELLFISSNEFPNIEFNLDNEEIKIDKEEFINGVTKAVVSSSTDKGILSGVCFTFNEDGYELGAIDGNRLSQVCFSNPLNTKGQIVIPRKILTDVLHNIEDEISLYFDDKSITLKTGAYLFKQNLLAGQFPLYKQLIPTVFKNKAIVDRNELLHSLEKVAIMCDDRTNITVFHFKDGELHLTTSCEN